jgi:hypothetical protein
MLAIFKRDTFFNIGKKRNSLAIKGAEKKGHWFAKFGFFFASLYKKSKILNSRYAWGPVLGSQVFSGFLFDEWLNIEPNLTPKIQKSWIF